MRETKMAGNGPGGGQPGIDEPSLAQLSMLMAYATQGGNVDLSQFGVSHDANKEKDRIAGRLSGFNVKDNPVWKEITAKFGTNIKQPELLSIADVLARHANIKLDRDAKRRKAVLIKWFNENWTQLQPWLDFVVLEEARKC
jgi:hypothetical protein